MQRDYVCRLRLVIDKLPLFFRESYFLFFIAKYLFKLPSELFTFRDNYKKGKVKDLSLFYDPNGTLNLERVSEDIDINSKHLRIIDEYIDFIKPKNILDVGCGTGFLLKLLDKKINNSQLNGIDFKCPDKFISINNNNICFESGNINNSLKSVQSNSFEVVICAHVLEHLPDPKELIFEMRRIASKRLILICPLEKPFSWGLNYHVQFFESSKRFVEYIRKNLKLTNHYECFENLGDCMYIETINNS